MLLPHVLFQICKGVEWLHIWTQRAFVLQQLPKGQERFPENYLIPSQQPDIFIAKQMFGQWQKAAFL